MPPVVGLIVAILAVSTASLFIRISQQDAPSLVIAAMRLSIAALVLAPFAFIHHRAALWSLQPRQIGLIALAGTFLALHFAAWITSLEYTSVASSVVMVTTTPLWVALLSPVFLKERVSRNVLIGMVLALAGGTVVALSDSCTLSGGLKCSGFDTFFQGEVFRGNFLALFGAWMAAGYLMVGRRVRESLSLVPYTFSVYGSAAVLLLVLVALGRLPLTGYAPQTYLLFLLLGMVPQLLGHSTLNWALKYLPTSTVSVALLGEPVGTIILAYFFLSETPSALELTGGALILAGIYLSSRLQSAAGAAAVEKASA